MQNERSPVGLENSKNLLFLEICEGEEKNALIIRFLLTKIDYSGELWFVIQVQKTESLEDLVQTYLEKKRNPLAHKVNPPGQHGAKRKKKSDYGVQLEEKQKLRACYGMLPQKTIVKYYRQAVQLEGNTQDLFLQRIETRLDNIVYRLKFALTPFHAQQLVSHGHILVDGKKVDIRSFEVKEGMVVSISEKGKKNALIQEALERSSVDVPEYLSLDGPGMNGKLLVKPHMDQIPLPIPVNVAVVCEFLAYTT